MKNSLYIFIMAIVCLSHSVAFAAGDDWKIVFLTDKEFNTHTGVEFHKNGKKAFGLKFEDTYRIGFMIPVGDNKHRFEFKGIYKQDEKNFKYQDYLIDIKGNGDKRYLLVTNWGGGNHGPYAHGYLIDTKDDFAIIGRIPTGEIYVYLFCNMAHDWCKRLSGNQSPYGAPLVRPLSDRSRPLCGPGDWRKVPHHLGRVLHLRRTRHAVLCVAGCGGGLYLHTLGGLPQA